MVTGNLKDYHQDDIIFMIERIRDGEQSASVHDLKALLSEVNNRQLGSEYATLVSELLRQRVALVALSQPQSGDLEQTRAIPVQKEEPEQVNAAPQPPKTEDVPLRRVPRQEERVPRRQLKEEKTTPEQQMMPAYNGREPYPVLRFMVTFAKTLGWILYALITLGGMAASALLLRNDVLVMISGMVLSFGVGIIFLLTFYIWAERTKLFLDIERHLRK